MKTNINWALLSTAHGNGTHLPGAIAGLNRQTDEERRRAYWQLDNYVVLQSDLYEAAYYVIEPIVELLEHNYTVDRLYTLRILTEIALGGNGSDRIVLQDTGEEKTIIQACTDKFLALKDRIARIELRTVEERKEKEDLLQAIDELM